VGLAQAGVGGLRASQSLQPNLNELLRPVHNRMPVILSQEDEEQWLDASRTLFAKAKSLLKPFPDELMDAHDVSPIVNSAKYDGPECIRPFSDDEIPRTRQLSLL
jgi:putative SOS response-associated peptidase YedK